MEAAIADFAGALAGVCRRVESAAADLSAATVRRPIPIDSAASAFVQGLERRVAAAGSGLAVLDAMALGTVSFEELLGHCTEVYKLNARLIDGLQDRLAQFGYVPDLGNEDEKNVDCSDGLDCLNLGNGVEPRKPARGYLSAGETNMKAWENDALFDDSHSLWDIGLSDACLPTIYTEGNNSSKRPEILSNSRTILSSVEEPLIKKASQVQTENGNNPEVQTLCLSSISKDVNAIKGKITADKDKFNQLPSYMTSLASWEELEEAVVKLNSFFQCNESLNQNNVEAIGLGRKGRSLLLILMRMNQLAVEAIDGSIYYSIPKN